MPNRLANETSPYLLQHKDNPVDWYPWGEEALARARDLDRPIMVSIGYSSCHWCHVMEHESFSDPVTAEALNEWFVCIKVDREERPDIDQLYITAVQVMGGRGGWPLNVFLLPDTTPFFGGTYWPPVGRHGLASFRQVLTAVSDAYRNRRVDLENTAAQLREFLVRASQAAPDPTDLDRSILADFAGDLVSRADLERGGFGPAPKFPQPMVLDVALRQLATNPDGPLQAVVRTTLTRMADGGMYDQIGGGFHRYSVDAEWLVPHFEKMLYDNAQLLSTYLDGWLLLGEERYREVADQTATYVLREMTDPSGAFYSAQDADTEGVEGKTFVWTPEEIRSLLLPGDAAIVIAAFGVTDAGNFEGENILNRPRPLADVAAELGTTAEEVDVVLRRASRKLLAARQQRPQPFRDEKAIASWNGMMLHAMSRTARILDRADALQAAKASGAFLTGAMRSDATLHRSWKDGTARGDGFLEDYASVAYGLISLYEATFERRWVEAAIDLTDEALRRFADPDSGLFFDTSPDHDRLLVRPRELQDSATPTGNSLLADTLLRLHRLTGRDGYRQHATGILRSMAEPLRQSPLGFGRMLGVASDYLSPAREIVLAGDRADDAFAALHAVSFGTYLPATVRAWAAPADPAVEHLIPLTADRPAKDGRPTAYVCVDQTCSLPVVTPEELTSLLR
ncbi:MAG TPA: thioredoxin domain-containing protein [Thermomicrobiales bacterium]|jgi:hypothetical protein|nr:thioredoxin domain-containing protein [Thermomicrobiales bacterium]